MLHLCAKRHRLLSDGNTPFESLFGQPSKRITFLFGSLVEYHPKIAEDQSRIHHFGKKVLTGLFLGYDLYAGVIWKGDVLIADLEELETMAASEIYSKRLNSKEVIFPKQGKYIFQSLMDESKNFWKRWPGGWGPQGRSPTGGGGLARVPNLRVYKHPTRESGTCRGRRMN